MLPLVNNILISTYSLEHKNQIPDQGMGGKKNQHHVFGASDSVHAISDVGHHSIPSAAQYGV